MKNNEFYLENEIDFNDRPLKLISVKELNTEPKRFQTMAQISVKKVTLFKHLIDKTEVMDFDLEANKENIHDLRNRLEQAKDYKTKEIIQKEIQKKSPNILQKIVLIVSRLLSLIEHEGYGIGVNNDEVFFYNRRYWEKIYKDIIIAFLGDFAQKCGLESIEAQQFKTKENLLKQFQVAAVIPDFNTKPDRVMIPVGNGTVMFKNGIPELKGFSKDHFLKYQLNFDYDPDAKAPIFQKFIERVLPDKKLQYVLFEFLGYIFLKDMKIEKMLLLYGFGSNGKSVLNDVIYGLLGKNNITNFSLASLCDSKSQTRALIENTLLNFAQEIGNGAFDVDIFKTLVSNQSCEVKVLYKTPYMIENYGRFAFNCNTLPKHSENTDGYFRRLIIIPFNQTISDEEKDINLAKKIVDSELPGVFNLLIEGMIRLNRQKMFTKSEIIDNEISKYRKESNSVLSFIDDENYHPSNINKLPLEVFYQLYKDYCNRNGFYACQVKNLSSQLRNAGFEVKRSTNGFTNVFYDKIIPNIDSDGATIIKI